MQEWIRTVLQSPKLTLIVLPAAFLFGLLGAVTSCCSVAAVGVVAGYATTRQTSGRRATVLLGLFFMLGIIIALVILGAVAGFIGQFAGSALGRYWKLFAGVVAIFFGLAALNLVPFKLPTLGSKMKTRSQGTMSAALFGLVVGGSATACSVGCNPLLAVPLGLATLQGQTLWGAAILGVFALGYSLPLTLLVLGFSLGKSALKAKKAATVARFVGGLLLVGIGFYLLATI